MCNFQRGNDRTNILIGRVFSLTSALIFFLCPPFGAIVNLGIHNASAGQRDQVDVRPPPVGRSQAPGGESRAQQSFSMRDQQFGDNYGFIIRVQGSNQSQVVRLYFVGLMATSRGSNGQVDHCAIAQLASGKVNFEDRGGGAPKWDSIWVLLSRFVSKYKMG